MPPETETPSGPADARPAPADPSRIHDIGYRSYDGERLGRGYARRSLFTQSLRGAYGLGRSAKSKVLPMILLAVMCLPTGVMVAIAVTTKAAELPVEYPRYALNLHLVVSLFLAAQAPQAVSRDLRFRTVPLYFSRPVERSDYVAAKFAAMTAALFVLTAAPLVVLYVGALLAELDASDQTVQFAQGLASAALLSLLFSGVGLLIAALTPRRGFGVAAIVAVLIVLYGAVTTVQAIAVQQGNQDLVTWLGLFSPVTLIDGVQAAFLDATSGFPGGKGPDTGAGAVYLLVVLGLIAGTYAALLRRYRKVGL